MQESGRVQPRDTHPPTFSVKSADGKPAGGMGWDQHSWCCWVRWVEFRNLLCRQRMDSKGSPTIPSVILVVLVPGSWCEVRVGPHSQCRLQRKDCMKGGGQKRSVAAWGQQEAQSLSSTANPDSHSRPDAANQH